jgi:hypothetical protein
VGSFFCIIFDGIAAGACTDRGGNPTCVFFETHREMSLWALKRGIKLHPADYLAGQLLHVTREGKPVLFIEGALCGLAERKPVKLLDDWDLDNL